MHRIQLRLGTDARQRAGPAWDSKGQILGEPRRLILATRLSGPEIRDSEFIKPLLTSNGKSYSEYF